MKRSSRRVFLATAVTGVVMVAAGAYVARPHLSKRAHPVLNVTSSRGVLQADEMQTVIALGETLAPSKFMLPQDFFREFVDDVTRTRPGLLKEYQGAVQLLDTHAQGFGDATRFHALASSARDEVLRALLWHYDAGNATARKLEGFATSRDVSALRIYVMDPMIEHYYRSPLGWAVVGYKSFPGMPPGNARAYTEPLRKGGAA